MELIIRKKGLPSAPHGAIESATIVCDLTRHGYLYCDECKNMDAPRIIFVGEDGYGVGQAHLCEKCLREALLMIADKITIYPQEPP